jgi:hypothetical protein
MTDPTESYEVIPAIDPVGWWTVICNGVPVRHFSDREKAERYASDPEYRASLVVQKLWER